MADQTAITIQHPNSLSLGTIASIISTVIKTDAPPLIVSLPISPTTQATVASYTGLGLLGIDMVSQIAGLIAAAHAQTPAPLAPQAGEAPAQS